MVAQFARDSRRVSRDSSRRELVRLRTVTNRTRKIRGVNITRKVSAAAAASQLQPISTFFSARNVLRGSTIVGILSMFLIFQ